jgi:hypothetical protein
MQKGLPFILSGGLHFLPGQHLTVKILNDTTDKMITDAEEDTSFSQGFQLKVQS